MGYGEFKFEVMNVTMLLFWISILDRGFVLPQLAFVAFFVYYLFIYLSNSPESSIFMVANRLWTAFNMDNVYEKSPAFTHNDMPQERKQTKIRIN